MNWAILASFGLVVIGAALRCFARDASTASLVLIHASFSLNAIAGPVGMAAVSKLSETWFPPTMRTFTTSVLVAANSFGSDAAFLVGPWMVSMIQLLDYPN